MNYYDAREIQKDGEGTGKWHYTSLNRRSGTRPVGYCSSVVPCSRCNSGVGKQGCPECEGKGYTRREEEHTHDTPDEARECFRRYLLDGQREESYGDWTGCIACDKPTKKGLTQRPPLGAGFPLCDEHRTPDQLAKLTPVPGQITASY